MATAKELIKVASAEVGYLEKETKKNLDSKKANAGDENYTKYARDLDSITGFYNGKKQGYAWCDVFVDWCFVQAFGVEKALALLGQPKKSYGAGCSWSAKYFKKIKQFYTEPKVGDQIFFKNAVGAVIHTGIVYDVDDMYVCTLEGNTSSENGVIANGGCVAWKRYSRDYNRIYGYGRPNYDAEPETYKPSVKEWQTAAIADGFKFPKYGADGVWGAECESVAKKAVCKKRITYKYKTLTKIVQKVVGVKADGLYGNDTKNAVIKYQKAHGLSADGEVGLNTWKKMLGV